MTGRRPKGQVHPHDSAVRAHARGRSGTTIRIGDREGGIDDRDRSPAEERFGVAFRAALIASVITSGERQRILDVNPAFEQLSGIARHDAIGRTMLEIGLWDDPRSADALLALTEGQATVRDERMRFRAGGGALAHVRLSGQPIALSDGPAYLWLAVDDTDRVAAEERMLATAAHLTAVVDASPLAIALLDTEQRVRLWNPAAERLLGWAAEDVLGQPSPIRSIGPGETPAMLEAVVATGSAVTRVVTLVDRLGHEVRVELSFAPATGPDGLPAGTLAMGADVRERERRAERLQLAQRMEAIGALAGGIAHDINNLMTTIGGNAALVGQLLGPGHPAREDLQQILGATERAADLTRQLLAFSRRSIVRPTVFDLAEEVRAAEASLRGLIGPDIGLEVDAPTAAWVEADPGQVERVLLNLAANARDAMPDGGTLRIAVGRATTDMAALDTGAVGVRAPESVVLTVADDGRGMEADVQARIFEPFFTTRPAGEGTGLGLAVVHGLVEQAGGRIEVESRPGAGTMFRVTLPGVAGEAAGPSDAAPAACAASDASAASASPRPTGDGATILLVDDEAAIRTLARRVLEARGHRVIEAEDGALGLERVRATPHIDLVLTDLTMPRMRGEELARQLVELRPTLPIVFMSGYGESRLAPQGVLDPSILLLAKPFAIGDLVTMVEGALRPPQG